MRVREPGGGRWWRREPAAPVPVDRPEAEVWADPPVLPYTVCEVVAMWRDGVLTPGTMPPADPFAGEPVPVMPRWHQAVRVVRSAAGFRRARGTRN